MILTSREWRQSREGRANFAADLSVWLVEAQAFLLDLRNYGVKRRTIRCGRSAVSELATNMLRHSFLWRNSLLGISVDEAGKVCIRTENLAVPASIESVKKLIEECRECRDLGLEAVSRLRDRLLSLPHKGGMGVWYLVTQLDCDLEVELSSSDKFICKCVTGGGEL